MQPHYHLKLFIAGKTPKSAVALTNLHAFCEQYLKGKYLLEIIDQIVHPEQAGVHEILAIPTLVKIEPEPVRRFIGNLSDQSKLLAGFNLP